MTRPGAFSFAISVARRTFRAWGWSTLPKLEKESMETRGSMPRARAVEAVSRAISASSSASGSTLTAQSARKSAPRGRRTR
jgi:hypothetical protein